MIRINSEHMYHTIRDYETLWHLAQRTSVVCFLDYSETIRDVAATLCADDFVQVSARGVCYVYAEDVDDFKKSCERVNLEFIPPPERAVSKMFPGTE